MIYMKGKMLNITSVLIGYCIPFSFLAMYGDVTFDSMWLYGLLIVGFGFLCWGCIQCHSLISLMLGNTFSCGVSIICVTLFRTSDWTWYFKPFTAVSMVMLLSVVVFIIQLVIWRIVTSRYKKER